MKTRAIKKSLTFFAMLIFLMVLFNSCNNSDKLNNSNNVDSKQGFIKIIPNSPNGLPSYTYKRTKAFSKQAGLYLLEDGFDSIFIRVWYPANDTTRVLDFKNEHGIWTGELHVLVNDENSDSIRIINIISEKIFPKSGWPGFIDNIFSLGIITLPDLSELPVYDMPTHAFFLYIEVATTTKYRIYTYAIPSEPTHVKEVSNIIDIMKLIEAEFGILSLVKSYYFWYNTEK